MIDRDNNQEKDVETGIPQRLPVSRILFLIYISRVFEQVEKELSGSFRSLLYDDNLGFITSEVLGQRNGQDRGKSWEDSF